MNSPFRIVVWPASLLYTPQKAHREADSGTSEEEETHGTKATAL